MRRACAGGTGAGDRCSASRAPAVQGPGGRGQRPHHTGGDEVLNQRRNKIFVLPDILCNAGRCGGQLLRVGARPPAILLGRGRCDEQALSRVGPGLRPGHGARADGDKVPRRTAAMAIGVAKVRSAKTRGDSSRNRNGRCDPHHSHTGAAMQQCGSTFGAAPTPAPSVRAAWPRSTRTLLMARPLRRPGHFLPRNRLRTDLSRPRLRRTTAPAPAAVRMYPARLT